MSAEPTVYLGTVGEGIWRSDDGGVHWSRASRGMFMECDVRAMVAHPQNTNILYAGTNDGCYYSEDGGDHWNHLESPMNDLVIWSLLILPHQPQTLFAGTRPARVYRSTDAGRSWELLDARMTQECPGILYSRVTTLRLDPDDSRCIWAGVEIDCVWCSRDGGETWTKYGQGLSSQDIHGLAIVPGQGNERTLLASTNNDLNLSTDEGRSWQPQHVAEIFPHPYCRGLVQRPDSPHVLFLGNGDGPPGSAGAAWRSTDGGHRWHRLGLPGTPNSTIWDFAVHPADPERVYAYSVSGGVYLSRDGGDGWEKLPREFGEIRSLLWVPPT